MCHCVTWEAPLCNLHMYWQNQRTELIAVWQQRVTAWTWSSRCERYNCCDCLPLDVLPHRSRSSPVIRDRARYGQFKQAAGGRPGHLLVISTLKSSSWVTICLWLCNTRQQRDKIAITLLIGISLWVHIIMHVAQTDPKSRPLHSWPKMFDFYIWIWIQICDKLAAQFCGVLLTEHLPEMGDDRPFVCTAPGCGQVCVFAFTFILKP